MEISGSPLRIQLVLADAPAVPPLVETESRKGLVFAAAETPFKSMRIIPSLGKATIIEDFHFKHFR